MTQQANPQNPMDADKLQEQYLTQAFEQAAVGSSKLFALDLSDIRGAYENKKQSLTTLYNEAADAKGARNRRIGWSIFWGVVFWPVALWTGYKAIESHGDFKNIKNEVTREVDFFRGKREQQNVSAKPSPFGTRVKM
jgi:hypothetical protein